MLLKEAPDYFGADWSLFSFPRVVIIFLFAIPEKYSVFSVCRSQEVGGISSAGFGRLSVMVCCEFCDGAHRHLLAVGIRLLAAGDRLLAAGNRLLAARTPGLVQTNRCPLREGNWCALPRMGRARHVCGVDRRAVARRAAVTAVYSAFVLGCPLRDVIVCLQ